MKVSILGFGTLVYFLTFATGVPIGNAAFCKEVGQRMTPGELQPTETLSFQDEQFARLPSLPQDSAPIAPFRMYDTEYEQDPIFKFTEQHFVKLEPDFSKDNIKRQWVDIESLPDKDLLNFSPIMFLLRQKRFSEAWMLITGLHDRLGNVDFLVAAKRTLGVVAKAYPMYFDIPVNLVVTADTDFAEIVFNANLEVAIRHHITPNFYAALLYTRDYAAISGLANVLRADDKDGDPQGVCMLFYNAVSKFPGFNEEKAYELLTSMDTEGNSPWTSTSDVERKMEWISDNLYYLEWFQNKTLEFESSRMLYANFTIEG
ncbi:hypothetical protein IWQ62_003185 [Dispira parvispora]|uniref:Uncharacterized protein n=1 Tax=Dispira parvispora TaxID=1520584 RepID=A0A9W8E7A1_9FUNG|nr:hypothetical protein IWQ62_003185 [Dispira parvispora]